MLCTKRFWSIKYIMTSGATVMAATAIITPRVNTSRVARLSAVTDSWQSLQRLLQAGKELGEHLVLAFRYINRRLEHIVPVPHDRKDRGNQQHRAARRPG